MKGDTRKPAKIGRYEVSDQLGAGGMGVVYLATDPLLRRTVAIKALPGDDEELRERFAREGRSAASLRHNNIVTIYDVGEDDGRPFLAMEFIDGESMGELIRRRAALTIEQRLKMMIELCAGLGYAHRNGIVHRDIKPGNLMITAEGTLKVLDFGLARITNESTSAGLTQVGSILGTPHYMCPEQVEGKPVDPRSDIFSVGLVLYELLSYQRAYPGDSTHVVLHNIIHTTPRPIQELVPAIDPDLVRVVEKAIQKAPDDRYQDLATMAADLERIRARAGSKTSETTRIEPRGPGRNSPVAAGEATPARVGRTRADPDLIVQRRATQVESHLKAAVAHMAAGRHEDVIAECENAMLLSPHDPRVLALITEAQTALDDRQARQFLDEARAHLGSGDLTAAQALVDQTLMIRADLEEALQLRREIRDQRAERERMAERARAASAALERARRKLDEGAFEAASRSAAEVLAYDSGNEGALDVRRRAAAAIEERRRQQEVDARAAEIVEQARIRTAAGDPRSALAALEAFDPPHPLVTDALAKARAACAALDQREREEAEQQRRRAIEEQRRRDTVASLKRDATEALQASRFADARSIVERAARELPGEPELDELRERIRAAEDAAEKARREAEERTRLEAEKKARREADERARVEAEKKAQREADERARLEAEKKTRRDADERARVEAEKKAQREADERARLEAEKKAQREADERARVEAEKKAQREADERARLEAEKKAQREAEERGRVEAEKKAQREADERARLEAEKKAQREAEERARVEAEKKARREAEESARVAAETKARREAEERARLEAEKKARREADEKARLEAEKKARREAEETKRRESKEDARRRAQEKEQQIAARTRDDETLTLERSRDTVLVIPPLLSGERPSSPAPAIAPDPTPVAELHAAVAGPSVIATRFSPATMGGIGAVIVVLVAGGWYFTRDREPSESPSVTTSAPVAATPNTTVKPTEPTTAANVPAAPLPAPPAANTPAAAEVANAEISRIHTAFTTAMRRNDLEQAAQLLRDAPPASRTDKTIAADTARVVAATKQRAGTALAESRKNPAASATDDFRAAEGKRLTAANLERNGQPLDAARDYLMASAGYTRALAAKPAPVNDVREVKSVPASTGASTGATNPPIPAPAPPPAVAETKSTPPPMPAPPPASAPADTTAADTAAISKTLAQFVSGYENLDAASIKRVYPNAPANLTFANVRSYSLTLDPPQISISGDRATVRTVRRLRVQMRAGSPQQQALPTEFTLRRVGNNWVVDSIK